MLGDGFQWIFCLGIAVGKPNHPTGGFVVREGAGFGLVSPAVTSGKLVTTGTLNYR